MSRSRLQDCTIALRALLEFLRCYCKCFQMGSKANNGLLGFDLSLIGEWILFEEISVVVRVKDNYY